MRPQERYFYRFAKLLLRHGADPNVIGCECTMLEEAINEEFPKLIDLLLANGTKPDLFESDKSFVTATDEYPEHNNNDLSLATKLLNHGAQIDKCNEYHDRAFALAIEQRRYVVVQFLLEHGASMEHLEDEEWTTDATIDGMFEREATIREAADWRGCFGALLPDAQTHIVACLSLRVPWISDENRADLILMML